MNHSTHSNGTSVPLASPQLDERIAKIENTLAALKDHVLTQPPPRSQQGLSPSAQRRINLDQVRNMLARHGEVTVADVRKVLGTSVKTATRLLHALNRERAGFLFFDPHGPTERLVLLHPSRAILDRPKATVN